MVALGDDSNAPTGSIALNGFRFDFDANDLLDEAGERVQVRPQCLALLRCLARNAGRVVAREDLMREVWHGLLVTDDSLVQCIGALRQALRDDAHLLLRTEPRRGYRLVPAQAPIGPPKPNGVLAQEVRFATTTDGVRIAYACCGEGVPVVRNPGNFSHLDHDMDCLTDGPLLRAMARGHRLIRFDRRGLGLSDRNVKMRSVDDGVLDMQAVVDAEGLSRFVIWSVGGVSGIRFAAQYPERVDRLILVGCSARGFGHRNDGVWGDIGPASDVLIEALWHDETSMIRTGGGPNELSRLYPAATPEQARSHDRLMMLSSSGANAVAMWRIALTFDVTADLERIRCPTLVLHSQRNRVVPLDEARLLATRIPNARLVTMDTDNHVPLPQEPAFDEMVRLIEAFIAQGAEQVPSTIPNRRTKAGAARRA